MRGMPKRNSETKIGKTSAVENSLKPDGYDRLYFSTTLQHSHRAKNL